MKCLVTGGAGFIGRWVVERLLREKHEVLALDDFSNGRKENLSGFEGRPGFLGLVQGDLTRADVLDPLFAREPWDVVLHLGASIHVQKSIDDPEPTFRNDALGTFRVLEACRRQYFARNGLDFDAKHFDFDRDVPRLKLRGPRVAVMSTCMVYDLAGGAAIRETHPYRPASPYAAAKIGADMLALSYFHAYRMPVTVVRPFNTYGPFQKSNSEGGVVSIFLKRDLAKEPLLVKGSGEQTRDLLYVEDCAEFVVKAALAEAVEGRIVNAGTGRDVSVNQLAALCCSPGNRVDRVAHDHPQAEIMKLCCDASLAKSLLGWEPRTTLEEGISRTRTWLADNRWAW
ncbi:MAG: GDP-mannose 4,6-dehydratase [Archangium sp.]|nr:GDP-mannose 4,6-dehydratase [Archangium sp.]